MTQNVPAIDAHSPWHCSGMTTAGHGNRTMLLVIFIMLLSGFPGCGTHKGPAGRKTETHTVGRVTIRDVLSQTGEIQPVVNVDIKSEASGKIEKIYVKEGQALERGDTILVIDPERLQTMRRKRILSVREAELNRDIAQRDFENAKNLVATGTVSQNSLQDLKTKYEAADIRYQLERLELKDVNDQLDKTVITAPMNGVLTSLDVKEGEIAVSATTGFQSGTAIGTIADITQLEVITRIGEVDYVNVHKGQQVVIKPEAIEGVQTHGTVTFVALSARKNSNEDLGTFEVRTSIDSLIKGIAPGINVNVEFLILEKENVLGVPNYFVREGPRGTMVSVRDEGGQVQQRTVRLGVTDYRNYEIVNGLREGEVVVLQPDTDNSRKPGRPGRPGRR